MNESSFKKEIFTLALPFMLQNILTNSFSFIDILMISNLGDYKVSAIAVVGQLSFILGMILSSISGITVYITQFFCVNDIKNARKSFVLMLQTSVFISLIAFILIQIFKINILNLLSKNTIVIENSISYLEIIVWIFPLQAIQTSFTNALLAIGKIKLSLVVNFVSMGINTILNYLLIYGKFGFPIMGIRGSATASLISVITSMLLIILYVYKNKYFFNISLQQFLQFDYIFSRKIFKRIVPLLFHEMLWSIGNVLYTIVFSYMGVVALTSFQLGKTFLNYMMIGVNGFSDAAKIMVGRQLSKSETSGIKYSRKLTKITLISALIVSILTLFLSPFLLRLFTGISIETKVYLQKIIYIQSVVTVFYFVNNLWIVGVFRAGGDNKFTMKMIFITTWLIGVPLTVLGGLVFKWSPSVVYFLFCLEEISKAIIGYFRYKSNRWAVNLTKEITE